VVGPLRRSSTRRSAWRRCASRRSATRRSFSSQVISVSGGATVRATGSNKASRSVGSSVQFAGIGASRHRSAPLSKVSQPRRYSSVRPIVLSGMVSQTIQWVPAWSSKSRSAMRDASCTGQTTAAKRGSDGKDGRVSGARRTVTGRRGRICDRRTGRRASRSGRNVAVGAARLFRQHAAARGRWHRPAERSRRAPTGSSGGAASSASRPRSPSRTRAASAGPTDRPPEGYCCENSTGRPCGGRPLVWTLNIDERGHERSRSMHRVRHHRGFRARAHTATVDQ